MTIKTRKGQELHECQKCGHKWLNRESRVPRLCPKCKSVRWAD